MEKIETNNKANSMKTYATMLCAGLLICTTSLYAQKKTAEPDPAGVLAYSLPSTTIVLEVDAVQEKYYAGPYAKYAEKYLGIEARQKDSQSYVLSKVHMTPYVEADQAERYLLDVGNASVNAAFLKLTSEGLISGSDGNFGSGSVWRFPTPSDKNFSDKGLMSNITSESATLYRNVKAESAYNKVAVKQEMLVEKSLEKRAAETAAMIFDIREKRYQIVTGDTDATYSGEAMGAAVEELTRLEKEYMTMFTGYSEYQTQTMSFEVVPQKNRENQLYVAFRISDTAGLLPADNLSGKPVVMEIIPQVPSAPFGQDKRGMKKSDVSVVYRLPAISTVKLTDGMNVILQSRIPVYQLGIESSFPVNIKVK